MSYDPHYANVSLLLHGDGADNGTVFTDNSPSPKTVTAYGNAKTSTAQSKFGGSSIALDGSGDYLQVPATSGGPLDMGGVDFTIDCWIYPTSFYNSSNTIFCICDSAGYTVIAASVYSSTQEIFFTIFNGTDYFTAKSSNTVSLNEFYFCSFVRNGGEIKVYLNGVGGPSVQVSGALAAPTSPFTIGRFGNYIDPSRYFNGYLDEIRVTKGIARYTGNFTPPTEPFPNSAPIIEVIASSGTPLGPVLAFAFTGNIGFASAVTPLGSVSALSVVVSACHIASGGPLGAPATLARYSIAARVSAASPLGVPATLAWHDFTAQLGDVVTRYVMDLITPTGTVRVPISSWQATLRTGASSYVQCVIPAAQPWGATINAATSFRVYRRAVTTGGQVFEYLMAEAPADTPQFDRGPTNHTCTLSGYAPGFAGQDVSPGTDRTLTGIRSISSGASYRVRCAVDWLLRPGQRGVVDGVPFVVEWINYYVNTNDAYMEAGT